MRFLIALFVLFAASTAARAERVEGWEVGAFKVDNDVSGCGMTAMYQDGTEFTLVLLPRKVWGIVLSHRSFTLTTGGSYEFQILIDGERVATQPAVALSNRAMFVVLEGVEMFRALQSGTRLDLKAGRWSNNFSLRGTRKAMNAVIDCIGREEASGGSGGRGSSSGGGGASAAMVPSAESVVVLANLLSLSGVSGHRILPLDKDGTVKFALSDGTVGTFAMAKGRGIPSADDYAQRVKEGLLKSCKGRSTIDQKSIATLDGSVVRKVIFGCIDTERRSMVETMVIRRSDDTLVDLSFFNLIDGAQRQELQMGDRDLLVKAAIEVAKR